MEGLFRTKRVLGKGQQDHVRNHKDFGVYSECERKPLEKFFFKFGEMI